MRSARATTRASSGVGTSSRRVLHSARAPCCWKARRYRLAKSSGGDGSVFMGLVLPSGWCKYAFIVFKMVKHASGLWSTIGPNMTPELLPEEEPQPQGLGEGSRLTGVFFEPAKTFADVAARPNFWAPLILIIVVSLAYMVLFGQHVGWERMIRHQTETSSRAAQQTPEQREAGIQMGVKFAPVMTYVVILLGVPLGTLIWAAVLLGIVKGMMSAQVRLKQVFAIIWYASLPGVIMALLAIAVMFM